MNQRPSTSILSITGMFPVERSARSLRRRLVVAAGIIALAVFGAVGYSGLYVLHQSMAGDSDARIANAASLSKQLVDRVLAERIRQVDLIASAPSTIVAAKKGNDISRQRGLPKLSIPQLEEMFKA